jgi:hypothetical protein
VDECLAANLIDVDAVSKCCKAVWASVKPCCCNLSLSWAECVLCACRLVVCSDQQASRLHVKDSNDIHAIILQTSAAGTQAAHVVSCSHEQNRSSEKLADCRTLSLRAVVCNAVLFFSQLIVPVCLCDRGSMQTSKTVTSRVTLHCFVPCSLVTAFRRTRHCKYEFPGGSSRAAAQFCKEQ